MSLCVRLELDGADRPSLAWLDAGDLRSGRGSIKTVADEGLGDLDLVPDRRETRSQVLEARVETLAACSHEEDAKRLPFAHISSLRGRSRWITGRPARVVAKAV